MNQTNESLPIYEKERERLKQRIHSITGTETAIALRKYRKEINKLSSINRRGVRAFPTKTTRGIKYRAADEIALCHAFLDQYKVDSCQ